MGEILEGALTRLGNERDEALRKLETVTGQRGRAMKGWESANLSIHEDEHLGGTQCRQACKDWRALLSEIEAGGES